MKMHVSEAKAKLDQLKKEREKYSSGLGVYEREYTNYLEVQIASYEKAIRAFENK